MNNLVSNAILQLGYLYDFLVSMVYSQYSSELSFKNQHCWAGSIN